MGFLKILGPEGHTEMVWDPADEDTVVVVRERFDELVRRNYLTYRTDPGLEASELIRSFDPRAHRITAIPPIRGGC